MRDRQIQELLLTHYLFAIEMVKEETDFHEAKKIIDILEVCDGVCACSKFGFNERIYDKRWVERNVQDNGDWYWGDTPSEASTKSEILSRLKLRVDILNKEIQLSK